MSIDPNATSGLSLAHLVESLAAAADTGAETGENVNVQITQHGLVTVIQNTTSPTIVASMLRSLLCSSSTCTVAAVSGTAGSRRLQGDSSLMTFVYSRVLVAGDTLEPPFISPTSLAAVLNVDPLAVQATLRVTELMARVTQIVLGDPAGAPAIVSSMQLFAETAATLLRLDASAIQFAEQPRFVAPPMPPPVQPPASPPSSPLKSPPKGEDLAAPSPPALLGDNDESSRPPPALPVADGSVQMEMAQSASTGATAATGSVIASIVCGTLVLIAVILVLTYRRCPHRLPGPCARLATKATTKATDQSTDQEAAPAAALQAIDAAAGTLPGSGEEEIHVDVASPQMGSEAWERPPVTPKHETRPGLPQGAQGQVDMEGFPTPPSYFPPKTPAEKEAWIANARRLVVQASCKSLGEAVTTVDHKSIMGVDMTITQGQMLWVIESADVPPGWVIAVRKSSSGIESARGLVPRDCVKVTKGSLPSISGSPSIMQSVFATPGTTTPAPTEGSMATPMVEMLDGESNEPRAVYDAARVLVEPPAAIEPVQQFAIDAPPPTPRAEEEAPGEDPLAERQTSDDVEPDQGSADSLAPAPASSLISGGDDEEPPADGAAREAAPALTLDAEPPDEDADVRMHAELKATTAEVMVPAGTAPGDIFRVIIADGRELTIRCPMDGSPGDMLEIDLPPIDTVVEQEPESPVGPRADMETAEVEIPPGLEPGQSFSATASWGGKFEVVVPRGTRPGSTLFVEMPKYPPAFSEETQAEPPAPAVISLFV